MDPADLEVFNQIMRSPNTLSLEGTMPSEETRTNLADLIVEKITAHEAGQKHVRVEPDSADHDDAVELPAKVVEAFSRSVSRSRAGEYDGGGEGPTTDAERMRTWHIGSVFCYHDINRVDSRNCSRCSRPFLVGTRSSRSCGRRNGRPTRATPRLGSWCRASRR